jgi:hypothetical protein
MLRKNVYSTDDFTAGREFQPRQVSPIASAIPASRGSKPPLVWPQAPLLARCSIRFRRIPVSTQSSFAFLQAGSGRRACPCSECARRASVRDNFCRGDVGMAFPARSAIVRGVTQQAERVSLPILQRCGTPHCGSIAGQCLAIATVHAVHID